MAETDDTQKHAAPDAGERLAYADDLYCPECGYSLRGLTSDRCPECGLLLDFIESETSLIPWERRREIGGRRAYWQTLALVIFRKKLFCRAVYRPVSYADAQRFRWVSILHAYVPMLLALAVVHAAHPDMLPRAADETGWWFVIFVCVCVLLALLTITGVPSYFFHPRHLSTEQQNRAVAISYYGCAELSLTPWAFFGLCGAAVADRIDTKLGALLGLAGLFILILVLIRLLVQPRFTWRAYLYPKAGIPLMIASVLIAICAVWVMIGEPPRDLAYMLGVPSALAPAVLVLLCWLDLIAIARQTLRQPLATLRVAVLVPVLWFVGGGLVLIGLPAVAYFLALVFYSLRGTGLSS